MFGSSLGFPELVFILVLALLIFGPKRLPEIGRTVGKGLAEFRRATNDLKRTIESEVALEDERETPRRPAALEPPRRTGAVERTEPFRRPPATEAAAPAVEPALPIAETAAAAAEDGPPAIPASPVSDTPPPATPA